ncbi:DNA repair protein [Laetiporus sulphureus 93-53]|uniref:DNA repair protein n=1 Tax=Laetiporus sulphureus 93-53 TaxID=1314785 RepID=A0A165E708_9APHY|nr:DNA repair protein [Laetiporus sulphureus 93-53]KZT06361.1 DNA repair protein [Laetiporus sulphureus 93-53]
MSELRDNARRLKTPPPRPPTDLELTPEQVKRIEINRLKAKAKQRDRELEASSSSTPNANNKRPLTVISASSSSPTAPKSEPKLKRDSRLGKYFEYDLSKMVNSKGGFLVENDKEVDGELRAKEKERERERAMQSLDPPIFLDPNLNPKCQECQSLDIDQTFKKVFGCLVCNSCKNAKPERYSLLTKTECKEDYLLTDGKVCWFLAELRDQEAMPHLLKANPHKSTFANMMLFLRYQVEEFAWKKWGSPEALDAEYERRAAEKKKKKNKKFEAGLKELRRRTRETVWQKRQDQEHKHVFGVVEKGRDGVGKQVNDGQEEHEQIATSLEVEQLDTNLFRSKSLWLPVRSRGVYGGQVISQALVSATQCVDPAYSLHCYFLLSASPAVPIVYHVGRARDGRSYATRTVKAKQRGRTVFVMLCSFQRPEPGQPFHQQPMPPNVPSPDACDDVEGYYERMLRYEGLEPRLKQYAEEYIEERRRSPIAVKAAGRINTSDGALVYMWWFKARNIPKYDAPFQKCILAYISDSQFIGVVRRTLGLNGHYEGPKQLVIDSFDCGDWLLYVVESPRSGNGRGVVHGRLYTRSGTLVAVTSQEGVVRARGNAPAKTSDDVKAKL